MSTLERLLAEEAQRFIATHPESARLGSAARRHWLNGVPMHWMADWGTPHPLFVREAAGAALIDVDGCEYADFCLGDSGALFGHSPPPVAAALAAQAARGLTCMLPPARSAEVGAMLAARFSLPYWQVTQSASDANRSVLRWARALTGRGKVLLFQGCYHGSVDETLLRLRGGVTVAREGGIGAPFDQAAAGVVVEFNDLAALDRALATGDIAAVLYEPVMTNIGMVLPEPGFLAALSGRARAAAALLIVDETHTLSSGLGGYCAEHGLDADFWVCGKAIAGGFPCAVFGFTAEVEARMQQVLSTRAAGHSGMGTTLAANPLAIECLAAALAELHTAPNHARMTAGAIRLEQALIARFARRRLDWHVARVGARIEFGFGPAPRNGSMAEAAMRPQFEHALHLYLLNRGVLVTPFHNMMLVSPVTTAAQIDLLLTTLDAALDAFGLAAQNA